MDHWKAALLQQLYFATEQWLTTGKLPSARLRVRARREELQWLCWRGGQRNGTKPGYTSCAR